MENSEHLDVTKQHSPEVLPSLIEFIAANEVAGFDSAEAHGDLDNQYQTTSFHSLSPSDAGTKTDVAHQRTHSVSISMPPSPMEVHLERGKRVLFRDNESIIINGDAAISQNASAKQGKFYSQPIPTGSAFDEAVRSGKFPPTNPRISKLKDKRFDSFKTWSGKLERQLSNLRGKQQETEPEVNNQEKADVEPLPVDRYFDALEGPELETLRSSEELLLPEDKRWPFLLRYPISSFGICLGVSSQAIMWKTLATSASTKFLHVSPNVNLILWCISVALTVIVAIMYSLKIIFYFEAVRREYYHPIRVNFFFAPWIVCLFLAQGIPPSFAENLHAAAWYILMTPIFCLELKIYGQWMSGGQRRLSKVANPSNHLSIVGNFVGALLGASMGLKEGPLFFFAVGLAHYTVLFVTLYQRLPTNETLPKELHPVFFLFVAAPSVASMAWARIQGSFDYASRIAYFIAMFLYFSLAVRVNFFRGFRFSLAWWAYTFPMTGASIATIKYSNEVTNIVTKSLSVILCCIATLTVTALLMTTMFHAFVRGELFPNDIAIAISDRKPKAVRKWYHRRSGSSDNKGHWRLGSSDSKEIENYLKFSNSDGKDVEACVTSLSPTTKEVDTCGSTEVQKNHTDCV
ncbi:hypothetical protein RJ639_010860 [Escallonia herrerae]|uniref:S-type anion channel SLAH2-like n=1 Tax=Escallonia herrerae TaxID=1293975 RepID=A0AA88VMX6_9ASTE|nr:hypothetical protein RJ639_010860 [Escallonia herrerae]